MNNKTKAALRAERDTFARALAYAELRQLDALTPYLEQVVNDLTEDLEG